MAEPVVFLGRLAMDSEQKRDAEEDDKTPDPSSLTGEAGRQARKQARDCMSGRFRP